MYYLGYDNYSIKIIITVIKMNKVEVQEKNSLEIFETNNKFKFLITG